MKLTALLACLCVLTYAAKHPLKYDPSATHGDGSRSRKQCLDEAQTLHIIARWVKLFEAVNEPLAKRTVTHGVTLYDDQVNFLAGPVSPSKPNKPLLPPGTPYNTGRDAFVKLERANQKNSPTFDNLITPLFWMHNCNNIVFRWQYTAKAFAFPGSTNKMGAAVQYKGFDFLNIQHDTYLIENATTSYDALDQLYAYGIRLCFQKNNATACG